MPATATFTRRPATAEELTSLRQSTRRGSTWLMLVAALPLFGLSYALYTRVSVVAGILLAAVLLWILVSCMTELTQHFRRDIALVRADQRLGEVEVITVSGAQPVQLPAPAEAIDLAFAFALPGNRTLVLAGQWLGYPPSFGVSWDDLQSSDTGGDYANELSPPCAFPTSAFSVHRFPASGVVVRLNLHGDYVAPATCVAQLDLDLLLSGAESMVFDCAVEDLAKLGNTLTTVGRSAPAQDPPPSPPPPTQRSAPPAR